MMRGVATWQCDDCGMTAAFVYTFKSGEPDPNAADDLMKTYDRIVIDGGPVPITISLRAGQMERVAAAIGKSDVRALFAINEEFAPFWCPDCEAAYCGDHYSHWDVYDEGFFDYVRGVCPSGHERILMD